MKSRKIFAIIVAFFLVFAYPCTVFADLPTFFNREEDNIFAHGNSDEKLIALTFDDGPHVKYTRQILEILDKYAVKATFFVIGKNVQLYPDIFLEIVADGHEIGNHTYSHNFNGKMSREQLDSELEKTEQIIEQLCSVRPTIFRPPMGFYNETVISLVSEYGYKTILWSVDSKDWMHRPESQIASTILKNATPGSIILCHDFIDKPSPTPAVLEAIIPRLLADGFTFVTVSELLA